MSCAPIGWTKGRAVQGAVERVTRGVVGRDIGVDGIVVSLIALPHLPIGSVDLAHGVGPAGPLSIQPRRPQPLVVRVHAVPIEGQAGDVDGGCESIVQSGGHRLSPLSIAASSASMRSSTVAVGSGSGASGCSAL